MTVRRASRVDLAAIAGVHVRAFPRSAITAMGPEAVRRYYEWQMDGEHVTPFVAECERGIVGFCFGGVFRGAMSGFLRRNALYLAATGVARAHHFVDARFRAHVWQGMRLLWKTAARPRRRAATASSAPPANDGAKSFGILAIATDPSHRSRGVGRMLMDAATGEARDAGFSRMHLSVDPGNVDAVRFYERLGWFRVHGQPAWRGHMECRLDGHSPGA